MYGGNEEDVPSDFSRDLENPSPNLSPCRGEALTFPPSIVGKQGCFIRSDQDFVKSIDQKF
jgi:hypothetical protein